MEDPEAIADESSRVAKLRDDLREVREFAYAYREIAPREQEKCSASLRLKPVNGRCPVCRRLGVGEVPSDDGREHGGMIRIHFVDVPHPLFPWEKTDE